MKHTLRELLGARVVDEDGSDLGTVLEMRCADPPVRTRTRETARVDHLIFGKHGWLERMGLRDSDAWEAQCKDVLRYERGMFVIRHARYRRQR